MSGLKDIKSSLRGAKLPNGQPMLLDEEQNSLALLIEQVSTAALQHCSAAAAGQARAELRGPAQGGVLHEPGRHHQRPGAAGQDSAGGVQGEAGGGYWSCKQSIVLNKPSWRSLLLWPSHG